MSNIWLPNGTKNNNTSTHMLLDHCYAFGLSMKPSVLKKFLEEGDTRDLFLPLPGPALGRIWPKTTPLVWDYEYFIPTKFRKHPPNGSIGKADFMFQYIYMDDAPYSFPNWRRQKGGDLTQSYDKSPYTNRNVKGTKWQHKQRHKKVRLNSYSGPT